MKRKSIFAVMIVASISLTSGALAATVESGAPLVPAVVDAGAGWMPILGKFVGMLLEVLTPVLVALASLAAWKIASKFGMEKNAMLDAKLKSLVKHGINYADKWAANQAKKTPSSDKKAQAVNFIVDLLNKDGIKKFTQTHIEKLIEAQLGSDDKLFPTTKEK